MFSSKKSDVLLFPERVLQNLKAVFLESLRGHSHHVRMHIINKVLLHLGDMDALTFGKVKKSFRRKHRGITKFLLGGTHAREVLKVRLTTSPPNRHGRGCGS